jgi:hypothetical protein
MIEAELQAVLSTHTTQSTTSRMHLKKWQKRQKRFIRVEGDYFKGDGGCKPKISF